MRPYYEHGGITIYHGDCLEVMAGLAPDSVAAIVTDPPYGLTSGKKGGRGVASVSLDSPYGRARIGTGNGPGGFMGKAWDGTGVAFDPAIWRQVLRVAKPGAHLFAFGGTRTFHRLTCAIEDAGWEVRDCLAWLYGSGFPKSHNGAWGGTALKPAWEPIILARKPLVGTVAANVAAHGTGGLNIDGCRVAGAPPSVPQPMFGSSTGLVYGFKAGEGRNGEMSDASGRWPANVALDEEAARLLDEQSGERPVGNSRQTTGGKDANGAGMFGSNGRLPTVAYADTGGASRFFYCAKASRAEREMGLEGRATNHHPTVKPVELMRWLCRLVTPPGGLVLDPFAGSGSTGVAAALEGFRFMGIEQEADYAEIARKRIVAAAAQGALDLG